MTRFARAKGSKASNERIPEQATDWSSMKQALLQKQDEQKQLQKRKELEKEREEKYYSFLSEMNKSQNTSSEWAEFSDDEDVPATKSPKPSHKKGANKKVNKETKEDSVSKEANKSPNKKAKESPRQKENGTPNKKVKMTPNGKTTPKKDFVLASPQSNEISSKKENGTPNKKVKMTPTGKTTPKKNFVLASPQSDEIASQKENGNPNKTVNKSPKEKSTPKKNFVLAPPPIDNDESDDAPEETSISHTPSKTPVQKKNKQKKPNLSIPSVATPNPKHPIAPIPSPKKSKKKQQKPNFEESNEWDNGEEAQPKPEVQQVTPNKKQNKKQKMTNGKSNQPKQANKRKIDDAEKFDGSKKPKVEEQKQRRKPESTQKQYITVRGVKEEIVMFGGFPIKKSDSIRLHALRQSLVNKGIPQKEIHRTILLERRKAEKSLSRDKKQVCFKCRGTGHVLSDCPELDNSEKLVDGFGKGICFKCGSTEHTSFVCKIKSKEFKFATCFVCNQQGHLAKSCPDNPKGMYPNGGACKECGDVTHLKRDCPSFQQKKEANEVTLKTIGNTNGIEDDESDQEMHQKKPSPKKSKIVTF